MHHPSSHGDRQALSEVLGLLKLHTEELPCSSTRSMLLAVAFRLQGFGRKQFGEGWDENLTLQDLGPGVFHLRDSEGSALCLAGADDYAATVMCPRCGEAVVALEQWSRAWTS